MVVVTYRDSRGTTHREHVAKPALTERTERIEALGGFVKAVAYWAEER